MGKTKTKSRSVGDSPKPPITIRSTNVKILDDNIAKLEKAIQASGVSANPSGTAEETLLSTIGIDGKKYELGPSAENTSYDNTDSGLTADDTQEAIDEVYGKIKNVSVVSTTTVTTSQDDSATLTLLSNGVKVLNYNGAHFPATETSDILTIPEGYRPVITSNIYSVGSTDQGKSRMIKIANNKLSAYAQADSDTGLYITAIYI